MVMRNFFKKHISSSRSEPNTSIGYSISDPEYMIGLNIQQREAVTTTEGYVRVIAGAGSGKTRALTSRVAYLIDTLGIAPENILCVTFTNKAANVMKNRIHNYLGDRSTGALIMTFGSLEARIIREDGNVIGYPKNYQIIDEEDGRRLLAKIITDTKQEFGVYEIDENIKVKFLKRVYIDKMQYYPQWLLQDLKDISSMILTLRKALKDKLDNEKVVQYMLMLYVYEKRKSFACDFHDLPYLCIWVLERSKTALEKWQDKLRYIMADEFQDASGSEYRILQMLQEKYRNLFVVGDPDQTIYTFRGSKVERFLKFDEDFQPTNDIYLLQNYRSGSRILDVSNTLVKKNRERLEKDLIPAMNDKGNVAYFHARTVYEEADFIIHNIKNFVNQGMDYDDIAILYRAHHVSRVLEEKLLGSQIPYRVLSGIGFYQRKEIKDVLAYMRLLIDGDDISFTRVINEPSRQIGPKSLRAIEENARIKSSTLLESYMELVHVSDKIFSNDKKRTFADFINKFKDNRDSIIATSHPLSGLLMYILEETGYEESLRIDGDEERLDNLSEFKQSLVDYEKSLGGEGAVIEEYLQQITLLTNQDIESDSGRVRLMTVHAAKGMEFPVVFVAALNEGIFPSSKVTKESEMEEERRLAYVAYTRAEKILILSDAEGVNFDGNKRYPSRFIFDANRVNIDYLVELDDDLLESYGKYPILASGKDAESRANFHQGDLVNHGAFLDGTVVRVEGDYSVVKFKSKDNELKVRSDTLTKVRP